MGSSRVSTGIEGFDRLVEGGFPRGDTILLIGNPGTGKTGFSAQFLYKGLVEGECGIYVSFSEGREAFFRNMNSIGLDFAKYEKEGKSYVTISIGCTGGRHRSVFIANSIAKHVEEEKYRVKVSHRDAEKKG